MNKKLLRQQVDDFFSKTRSQHLTAWHQYRKQLKSTLKSQKPSHPSTKSSSKKALSSPSPPLTKTKEFIDHLFKKSAKSDSSLESLSEIVKKEENPTLSLNFNSLPALLPIKSIQKIRNLLRTTTPDGEYLKELLLLSEDIQKYSNQSNFS